MKNKGKKIPRRGTGYAEVYTIKTDSAPLRGIPDGLGLVVDEGLFAVRVGGAADFALGTVASAGGAVLATIGDNLQVQFFPVLPRPEFLEVGLGLLDIFPVGQSPPLGEAVDMRIDRKGGDLESVDHDDTGGFMTDAR